MVALDQTEKADIERRLRQTDAGIRELADEYGVSHTTIYRISRKVRRRVLPDLTGRVFGEWTVLKRAPDIYGTKWGGHRYWWCQCLCGNEVPVRSTSLTNGKSSRCRECQPKRAAQIRREKLLAD